MGGWKIRCNNFFHTYLNIYICILNKLLKFVQVDDAVNAAVKAFDPSSKFYFNILLFIIKN